MTAISTYHSFFFSTDCDRKVLLESQQLRASVFCNELRWVEERNGLDQDEYDKYANHFVIQSSSGEVLATARVINSNLPWMMERYFPLALPPDFSLNEKHRGCEISRFAVHKSVRGEVLPNKRTIADYLLKGILEYTDHFGVATLYMITSHSVYRFLRYRGYPVCINNKAPVMPDGSIILLCSLTIDDLKTGKNKRTRALCDWLSSIDLLQVSSLLPSTQQQSQHII